jgi:Uroporphyrinogen-III decarboxylase
MNRRETFNACMMMEPADRVPVFLFDLSLGMDVLDVLTTDVFPNGKFNGKLGGKCILALQEYLGQDAVIGTYRSIDVTAFGGEMAFPERGIPYIKRSPFKDADDLYKYNAIDIADHMQDSVDSFYTIREARPDLGLLMNIPAAMSTAMVLRGLENFLMDLSLEPRYSHELISFAADVSRISVEVMSQRVDLDAVLLTAAYDNLDMVGQDMLREFSFPWLKASEKHIHGLGIPIMFHPHGGLTDNVDSERVLDEMIDVGFDSFYYGEMIDPDVMLAHTEGKCSLCGGIDTFTTIYLGPDERVRDDVSRYLKHFDGNYIFSPSCSVDRKLSLPRLKIMMDTVSQ